MRKKFLIVTMCVALSVSALTGCSGKESTNPSVVVGEVTQTPKNYYEGDEFEIVLWKGEKITSLPDSLVFHRETVGDKTKDVTRYYTCPDYETEGITENGTEYGIISSEDGKAKGYEILSHAAKTEGGYAFDVNACNHFTSKTGLKLGLSKDEAFEIFKKYEGYDNITVHTEELGSFDMTYRHISDGKNDYSIVIAVVFSHHSTDPKVTQLKITRTDFNE